MVSVYYYTSKVSDSPVFMQSAQKIDDRDSDRLITGITLGDCPRSSVSLVCRESVLDQIRKEVFDKFLSIPRGGLEIGGVLFGAVTPNELRLLTYRPLQIEYLNGPGFALSSQDEINLGQLIEAPQSAPDLAGMEAIGWYHSHTRSDISLSEEDIALHERFFPRPQHCALVIRPHKFEPAQFAFYVRNADGTLPRDASQATFTVPSPEEDKIKRKGKTDPPTVVPLPVTLPVHTPTYDSSTGPSTFGPNPRHALTVDSDKKIQGNFNRAAPATNRGIRLIAAVSMVLALCAAALVLRQNRLFQNPAPVISEQMPMWVRLSDTGGQLSITWNRSSPAVAQAKSAEILIIDGGLQTASVSLERETLNRGTITYVRRSGNVEVRMRVHSQADRVREEVVRFIGPEMPTQPAPVVSVIREGPDPEVVRIKQEMERLKQELAHAHPEGTRARSVPVQPSAGPTETTLGRVAAPPALLSSTSNVADIRPPMLTAQTQLVLPSPVWQPPAVAKPPAVAPPVQQRAVLQNPSAGRAIWTGRLPKGGLLLLEGTRPSVGTVSGSLPERAARFNVYAADLSDSGLVVYTDGARNNAVEPPSSSNGWNLTTFKSDPKRVRSITVLEYPRVQNGWKRLLVRAEDRPLSILVIDWTEMPRNAER